MAFYTFQPIDRQPIPFALTMSTIESRVIAAFIAAFLEYGIAHAIVFWAVGVWRNDSLRREA